MLIRGFSGQTDFGPFCFLTAPRFGLFSRQELRAAPELGARSWKLEAGCLQRLNLTVGAIIWYNNYRKSKGECKYGDFD